MVSNLVGDLLGNAYFAQRMGARNDGAWKRFIMALKAADMGKAAGVSKGDAEVSLRTLQVLRQGRGRCRKRCEGCLDCG